MRRILAVATAILLLICMSVSVFAVPTASSMEFSANITADGMCQVTQRMTLYLDAPAELTFPVPYNARDIRVNGAGASGSRSGDVLLVNLSRFIGNIAGTASVTMTYTLPNLVEDENGALTLEVPMLCGFACPVEQMTFSITLPGEITGKPTFTSTYHQTLIQQNMEYSVDGNLITGSLTTRLMDRDWLVMTLPVTEELFPQEHPIVWSMDLPEVLMVIFAVLAVAYWIFFLRCLPPRQLRRANPPEALNAGDIGAALTGCRTDLTMLVVHWAQLGYILIHLDDNGRVFLHKRMGMGNERSGFENRIFKHLFGKRNVIDGTGLHYAQLCRKVAAGKPGIHGLFRRQSGSVYIFRGLVALIGLFAGASAGTILGIDSIFQGLLIFFLSILGFVSAWLMQEGFKHLHLRRKITLWISLGIALAWLGLGLIANEFNVAACNVAAQLVAGLAAAYGGRRTDLGKQLMAQTLGLRRYLTGISMDEIRRNLALNADFYHNLAPFALAMGVDTAFARRFRGIRLPACPYLTTGMDGHMTAADWSRLLRDAVDALDERQQQLFWERLMGGK